MFFIIFLLKQANDMDSLQKYHVFDFEAVSVVGKIF